MHITIANNCNLVQLVKGFWLENHEGAAVSISGQFKYKMVEKVIKGKKINSPDEPIPFSSGTGCFVCYSHRAAQKKIAALCDANHSYKLNYFRICSGLVLAKQKMDKIQTSFFDVPVNNTIEWIKKSIHYARRGMKLAELFTRCKGENYRQLHERMRTGKSPVSLVPLNQRAVFKRELIALGYGQN